MIAYAGKSEIAFVAHFHAWTRLTRRRGEAVEVEILRGRRRIDLDITLR